MGSTLIIAVGPHSLKDFVFPSQSTLLECRYEGGRLVIAMAEEPVMPLAVIGARSCDLHALRAQDRVFLEDRFVNPVYQARRQGLFVVAVNCGRAAPTCFCSSMNTGPAVSSGFDLCLTEMPDHFLVEVGTERGGDVISPAPWRPCSTREVIDAQQVPRRAEQANGTAPTPTSRTAEGTISRSDRSARRVARNLEHEHWDKVAERCLSCGNCTMVCPTCFCSRVDDVSDLTDHTVRRVQTWDSCFNVRTFLHE